MDLRRLFIGGYQELRRPVNVVDESLMTRIERAREQLRLQGKDVIAVLQTVPKPTQVPPQQKAANH
ncbi:MAG TPA: hypothetical protein VFO94_09915 [Gammaproteobacteria bacterium]|nr:hypothetical protein [Gammaproteobacteria bacterium]